MCQHGHPPAHSQHRSCSESKPTLDKCASCTGVFLCWHVSVYVCIHHICQHVAVFGHQPGNELLFNCAVLEEACFLSIMTSFGGHPAQKGEITSGTLTHPDSSRSYSLSHSWLERPVIKHRWLDTRIKPYYAPCIYHSRPIISEWRKVCG